MFDKIIMLFACLIICGMTASPAFSAGEEPLLEDEANNAPVKKKQPGAKEIEANKSVQAPAPANPAAMSEEQLQMLSSIVSATQMENAQLNLMDAQLKRLELKQKIEAIINKPSPEEERMIKEANEQISQQRVTFPMPGGNPQVTGILGGNKKAMEATLVFPSGITYEVTKGMMLEGGYKVSSISSKGVTLEKNGLVMTMPVSRGSAKQAPPDMSQEMGMRQDSASAPMGGMPGNMPPEGMPQP